MNNTKIEIKNIYCIEVDYDNSAVFVECYNESLQDGVDLEFKITIDGAKVWRDSYGVEGSPTWIDTNVADVYKLSLIGDEYEVSEDVIKHLIEATVDEVESSVIDERLKESVCDY